MELYLIIGLCVVNTLILAGLLISRLSPGRTDRDIDGRLTRVEDKIDNLGAESRQLREDNIRYNASSRSGLESMQTGFYKSIEATSVQLKNSAETADRLRRELIADINALKQETARQLELIRSTVDEKLTENLDNRLANSFRIVKDTLEAVTKGVGEMQSLASGVDSLKSLLTNVKTRGNWGEISLDNLLSDILTQDQYYKQYRITPSSAEAVDYAVVMPGRDKSKVLLPIDAKFPTEDYQRLIDASARGDRASADRAVAELSMRIKVQARSIRDKYIKPPYTTDFALMFLPTEGLYAEVIRIAGLAEELQNKYRVIIAGPTTLAALLNSLQMGFRTLAVEKRTTEIGVLLVKFKQDFAKFSSLLQKTQQKLSEVTSVIDKASDRTRLIEKRLMKVELLPGEEESDVGSEPLPSDDRE